MFTRYRARITRARDPGGPGQTGRANSGGERAGYYARMYRVSPVSASASWLDIDRRANVEKCAAGGGYREDRFCKKKIFAIDKKNIIVFVGICVSFYIKIKIRNSGLLRYYCWLFSR